VDNIDCTLDGVCHPDTGCDFSQSDCDQPCQLCDVSTGKCYDKCATGIECLGYIGCDSRGDECIYEPNDSLCEATEGNKVCLVPVCTEVGCGYKKQECGPNPNPCKEYFCNPTTGSCLAEQDNPNISCNDNIACTIDSCVANANNQPVCGHVPNDAECGKDKPLCYDKKCNPELGCEVSPNNNKCSLSAEHQGISCFEPRCTIDGCFDYDKCPDIKGKPNCFCSTTRRDCSCSGSN
jgi:hypothetical protein